MLEALNLTKSFIGIPAVDGVSFTIRPGEILGYLGPNGAGKSTTVKMLTGLLEPTGGRVLFHGQDIRNDKKAFQRRLGYVPEEPHLYPHLSGREYLQLAGRLRGIPRRVLEPRSSHVLEVVEKVAHNVLILRKGRVVAHDSVARLREVMSESSLEGVFTQLTNPEDTDAIAHRILEAVAA
jgi:ABC-type multidrug transport system ATPase subunit